MTLLLQVTWCYIEKNESNLLTASSCPGEKKGGGVLSEFELRKEARLR